MKRFTVVVLGLKYTVLLVRASVSLKIMLQLRKGKDLHFQLGNM